VPAEVWSSCVCAGRTWPSIKVSSLNSTSSWLPADSASCKSTRPVTIWPRAATTQPLATSGCSSDALNGRRLVLVAREPFADAHWIMVPAGKVIVVGRLGSKNPFWGAASGVGFHPTVGPSRVLAWLILSRDRQVARQTAEASKTDRNPFLNTRLFKISWLAFIWILLWFGQIIQSRRFKKGARVNMYCRLRRMRCKTPSPSCPGAFLSFHRLLRVDIRSPSPATIGTVVAAFWGLLSRSEGGQSG